MEDTIIITMDSAGRLVVPKAIREQSGFNPDTPLEIAFRDGRIEIAPAPRRVSVVKQVRVAVAFPDEVSELLASDAVRQTQRRLRKRRG